MFHRCILLLSLLGQDVVSIHGLFVEILELAEVQFVLLELEHPLDELLDSIDSSDTFLFLALVLLLQFSDGLHVYLGA